MSKRRKVTQITALEHAKRKSMWTGSKKIQEIEMYIFDDKLKKFKLQKIKFAPTFYKIIDEVIVNAIDHWVNFPKKVKTIKIKFDEDTGEISVYNDGPGIEVELTENVHGKEMYTVQMIASEFFAGDNLEEGEERTTGGTNGAGLKLTNAFSDFLTIYTTDKENGLYYKQKFEDRLNIIKEPKVRKITSKKTPTERKSPHTEIVFTPSYSNLGYNEGYDKDRDASNISKLIKTRAMQAAAYTTCDIHYNEEVLEIPDIQSKKKTNKNYPLEKFKAFSKMFLEENDTKESDDTLNSDDILMATTLKGLKDKDGNDLQWHICVGRSDGQARDVSLINGIWVHKGGTHVKHLQNLIVKEIKPKADALVKKVKSKFNKNHITNNLFIFMMGAIVNPDFTSQVKDELQDPIAKFKKYQFAKKDYGKIWGILESSIMLMFFDKEVDKEKNKVVRGSVRVPKSRDAKFAGHKTKYARCKMIVCEGDSAMGTVKDGITSSKTELSYDYYGTFSLQGVPMNARKQCKIFEDKKTKKQCIMRSDKLKNNERLSSYVKIMGLDYAKSYKTKAERATLRYGCVIAAVDQDEDGKGQIFGLFLNFMVLFWPELVKQGYVKRFNTPIIRAYPKSKKKYVEEFFYKSEYKNWIVRDFKGDEEAAEKQYKIKYYKGLGSHKKQEIPHMFKKFDDMICTYVLDKEGERNMEGFLGNDTSFRKKVLATPVDIEPTIGKTIPVSEQCLIDLKSFQRDNILRKLPSVVDGQVPARRKLICEARNQFGLTPGVNKEMKVNAFVNAASKNMGYEHGESSLVKTATGMGQDFEGSNHYPYLRPEGQFGTRSAGGNDAADGRYIYTKLNQRFCWQMLPKEDDFILPYVMKEGKRCEPKYYVPVLPFAIMENMQLPGTGWKIKVWARDPYQIIKNVKKMIKGKREACKPLKLFQGKINTDIVNKKGRAYSVGDYHINEDDNEVIVTELPLGVYAQQLTGEIEDDKKKKERKKKEKEAEKKGKKVVQNTWLIKDEIAEVYDHTNDEEVRIVVKFKPGELEKIQERDNDDVFDNIVKYLNLKNSLDENINMISVDDEVIEFKDYHSVVDMWFQVRKNLYADRIDRTNILLDLRIKFLENIARFASNRKKYGITDETEDEEIEAILIKHKYDTFNQALLNSPKYTEVSKLRNLIMNSTIPGQTTYKYILDLRVRDMIKRACDARIKKIKELKEQLDAILDDMGDDDLPKGGKAWLREIDELEKTIKLGFKLGWDYGEDKAKFRD